MPEAPDKARYIGPHLWAFLEDATVVFKPRGLISEPLLDDPVPRTVGRWDVRYVAIEQRGVRHDERCMSLEPVLAEVLK